MRRGSNLPAGAARVDGSMIGLFHPLRRRRAPPQKNTCGCVAAKVINRSAGIR